MNRSGLDFNVRSGGQTAEEIHHATAADDGQGHAPSRWVSRSFNDGVGTTLVVGQSFHGGNNVWYLVYVDRDDGSETARHIERGGAPGDGDNPDAAAGKHANKLQPNRAAANYNRGIARAHFHLMNPAKHAGKRLGKRSALIIHGMRDFEHVFHGDAARNAHVLGISAIVEEQIVAKILLATAAVVATQARRGIRRHHTHSEAPARINAFARGYDVANQLMAKYRRRLNHARVIAALPNFEVGAVGERKADAQKHFVSGQRRNVDHLNPEILAAIEDGRRHF